jgi:hypothetical protein
MSSTPATGEKRHIHFGSLAEAETQRIKKQNTSEGAYEGGITISTIDPEGKVVSKSSVKGPQVSKEVAEGIKAGHINVTTRESEHLALSDTSLQSKAQQLDNIRAVEFARRARTVLVPTNDEQVKIRLRTLQHPITLFGEKAPSLTPNPFNPLFPHAGSGASGASS